MSEDLIRRSDAIEAIEVIDWYHQNRNNDMVSGANSDEHQAWYKADDVYKALKAVPSTDIPSKVVAQITFDEEKLREIVKKAVERFKEEYEIADKPTVIRVKSIMRKEDYESLADSIRQQAPTAIVIPHNAELVTPADRPQGWTLCSERLPDACKEVLLTCEVRPINHKPFRYVCKAQWIPKFCKEALSIDWDEEATEYCEEDDEFYPHEGWYESISNWDDYSLVGISDFAIAWKPLPNPWKGADDE